MQRLFFTLILLTLSSGILAQANTAGTVQFNVSTLFQLHLGEASTNLPHTYAENIGLGAKFDATIGAHYSLNKTISAGLSVSYENSAIYNPSASDRYGAEVYNRGFSETGLGSEIDIRFFILNKENALLYIAPSVGYVYYKDVNKVTFKEEKYVYSYNRGKSSGFEYGLIMGHQKFFTNHIGMFEEIGFSFLSSHGIFQNQPEANKTYKVYSLGLRIRMGLVVKLNGNKNQK